MYAMAKYIYIYIYLINGVLWQNITMTLIQKIFQVVAGHFNQIPLFIPVTGPLTNRIMEGFIFNYNVIILLIEWL